MCAKLTKDESRGGQVVSVLAFYTDDPCSNPAEAYRFFSVKFVFEKKESKEKEAGWPIYFTKVEHQISKYLLTILALHLPGSNWFKA